jgi:predicted dehydrogenase
MRLIQVGTGLWGASWAEVVASSPHWELAALVDIDPDALGPVARAVGVDEAFTSFAEALDRVQADAALVVVPPEVHREVAEQALEAGLHCMVEKPFADTMDGARAVVELAERVGRTVMVSQNFRFKRGPRTVRRLIADGAIGRIGAAYVRFFHAPPFTGFRVEMDQPLIVDMAVHHLDQVRGILGIEPVSIEARSFNPSWSWFAGDASANMQLTTADGAVVNYTGSWVSRTPPTSWDGTWEVHGERGAIRLEENRITLFPSELGDDVFRRGALQRAGNVMDVELIAMGEEERWATLAEFAASIAEGREPETSGRDNLRSLALVLGAVESARRGEPVAL